MTVPLEFYEAIQADYPRWEGEDRVHYLERVSILAGGMKREDASEVGPDEDIKARQGRARPKPAPAVRLPYKDSDDEPRVETFRESEARDVRPKPAPPLYNRAPEPKKEPLRKESPKPTPAPVVEEDEFF